VAGPYERKQPGHHPLLASGNQELVHVTERYRAWTEARGAKPRRVEMRIGSDGWLRMSGFPRASMRAFTKPLPNR
jgi:hypothetical protein